MVEKEINGGLLQKHERRRDRIYDILAIFLGLFSLFLGFLIYAHNDSEGVFISKVIHKNVSFADFNAKINSFFDSFLSFDKKSGEDRPVLGEINYVSLGDDRFMSTEQFVPTLTDGTVTYVTSESDGSFSVVVSYATFDAIYHNLTNVEVKAADRLKGGDSLGGYENYFKAFFRQGDKFVTYDEIFH